jgi:hypothetical protein
MMILSPLKFNAPWLGTAKTNLGGKVSLGPPVGGICWPQLEKNNVATNATAKNAIVLL